MAGNKLTESDYRRAAVFLSEFSHRMEPPQTDGEVWCVLDAEANGDDPAEHLAEYRFWRSPHGRQVELDELFESAHPTATGGT